MARNILRKGFPLYVYNRTQAKAVELEQEGAIVVGSPRELSERNVDVVITMVTGAEDVREVLFGDNGVVHSAKPGTIFIDMSTIGPTAAVAIQEELQSHGMHFIDAPVTGSTPGAINGTLTIFIGAEVEPLEKARPVFEAMGTNLQHMGPVGSGQAIKMINNHMIAATIQALSEAMLLADGMGLSRQKVADVLKTASIASPVMKLKIDNYVTEDFDLLFTVANMRKDLRLALDEALKAHKELPVLQTVEGQYEKAMEKQLGDEDFSAVIKVMKK